MRIRPILLLTFLLSATASALAQDPRALYEEAKKVHGADGPRSLQLLEQALTQLRQRDNVALRMDILDDRCWFTAAVRPAEVTIELANRSIAEARAAGRPATVASLQVCRGNAYEQAGKLSEAFRDYEFGVAEGVRLGHRKVEAAARVMRGQLYYYRGAFALALGDLLRAHQIYVALGLEGSQGSALNAIANVYADPRVGQYDRAIEYYRQNLALHEKNGSLGGQATTQFNIGSTLEQTGNFDAALRHYELALALERRRGNDNEVAYVQRALGIVLTKLGRTDVALRRLNAAITHFDRTGNEEGLMMTSLSRGVTLVAMKRPAEALPDLDRARQYYQRNDNARFLEKVEEQRALALAATGQWKAAYDARGAQLALGRKLAEQLREEHTSRLRIQFDSEKKEQENRALARENALRGKALSDAARIRTLQTAVLVLSGVVIAVLGILAARHFATARRMRIMALTDELTRLPNRRHLLLLAEAAIRAAREHEPLSLLALDIDHFKRINDTHGHETGDVVLRRVAQTCRAVLRRDDAIGRTGGEEFLAVLPRTDAATAREAAERLRAAVEALDWSDVAPGLRVTVSIGAAAWDEREDFASLTRRADASLYQAKAAGRNRIEVAYA